MRWLPVALAATLLLSGCDDETMRILAGATETGKSTGAGAKTSPRGTTAPTPKPAVARMAPLDLTGVTWAADQPDTWKVEGDRVVAPPKGKDAYLFYTPPLGDRYTMSFHEPRETVTGDVNIMWRLDRTVGTKKDEAGQSIPTGEMQLMLKGSGLCEVRTEDRVIVSRKVTGPRTWEIQVDGDHSRVRLNGELFSEFDHVPGYHPSPFILLKGHSTKPGEMAFENVRVTSSPVGARHTVLRQWSLEGRDTGVGRLNLIYASDLPKLPSPERLDTLPAQFTHVVALGGYPLHRNAALLWARTDNFSGGHYTSGSGIFLAPWLCDANYVAAHEMAHGYRAAGSQKARPKEHWLIEGFASYMGTASHNRALGQPVWKGSTTKVWNYDPPLTETDDETRAHGGDMRVKHYTKGQIFLQVMSAYTSPEQVTGVFKSIREVSEVSGDSFLKVLETRTGKDLGFLRPGWLYPGAYEGVSPKDAKDTDKDGLVDFQEIAWGTNPASKDSDADGVSDFAEKVVGTDPLTPATTTGLIGFTSGLGMGELPDEEAEEASVHEEGVVDDDEEHI